jgi:hypothetical protein
MAASGERGSSIGVDLPMPPITATTGGGELLVRGV